MLDRAMDTTIGDKVRERMTALDLTSSEVARKAGLERTFVHDLLTQRKRTVAAKPLIALAHALNCSPEFLVGAPDVTTKQPATIPLLGVAETGVWRDAGVEYMDIKDKNFPTFSPMWGHPEIGALLVRGHGATGLGIVDGSIVALATPDTNPGHGDVIAIQRTKGGLREISLRKIEKHGSQLLLEAKSKHHKWPAIEWPHLGKDEVIDVLGRVTRATILFV